MGLLVGLGPFRGCHLRLSQDHAVLGHLGVNALGPVLHGLQIMAQPNRAHPERRDQHSHVSPTSDSRCWFTLDYSWRAREGTKSIPVRVEPTNVHPQVIILLVDEIALDRGQIATLASLDTDRGGKISFRDPPIEPITDVCKGEVVSFFSAFATSFGSMLLMGALIAAWLFRSSDAPLVAKIAVPTLVVALACATPYQVNAMLGFPISAPLATLPARAELIAFVTQDNDARVDLWLRQGGAPPRAYETALNDKLKQILRNAQSKLGHGGRVVLVKTQSRTKRTGVTEQRPSDEPGYELDDSAFSLPQKN